MQIQILAGLAIGAAMCVPSSAVADGRTVGDTAAGIVAVMGAVPAAHMEFLAESSWNAPPLFSPPLPLEVVTPFRPPAFRYGTGHRGVDLAAEPGTVIVAAGDGVVVFAGVLAGRGVVSIEHHGGLRTTYEPVTASVAAGDAVRRGEVIGIVDPGHVPCAGAACVHFGARMPDHVYLDPLALFRTWEVRLKPWAGLPADGRAG